MEDKKVVNFNRSKKIPKLDVCALREEFPILDLAKDGTLNEEIEKLIYFDNAATTQKPHDVLYAITEYYRLCNANVHRGAHMLSATATRLFEDSRLNVARFLKAESENEVIWTRGTTDSINIIASSFADQVLEKGDKILVTALEHHSNLVPWQMAAIRNNAELVVAPIDDKGDVDLNAYKKLMQDGVKIAAFCHVSNAIGTVNPIVEMVDIARENGAYTVIDGAQGIAHFDINVKEIGADFYVFSGHKMYAPTGIGVLWGKRAHLESMTPVMYGGEMIKTVSFERSTFNDLPYKFEAGTPNIEGAYGMSAAIDFMRTQNILSMHLHERNLMERLIEGSNKRTWIHRIGRAKEQHGSFSFLIEGAHPYDVGTLLDQAGVAVRTGDHCTQPLMDIFNVPGTVRVSVAAYNTIDEVDTFFEKLDYVKRLLS